MARMSITNIATAIKIKRVALTVVAENDLAGDFMLNPL
jgi:hypothetical protein